MKTQTRETATACSTAELFFKKLVNAALEVKLFTFSKLKHNKKVYVKDKFL